MKHRFATREDLVGWFGNVPSTMRAMVMEEGGVVYGIAGLVRMKDHVQAFSAYKPELREKASTMEMSRMAVAFAKMLEETPGAVLAICSQTEPTAPRLLEYLGFEPDGGVWRRG